MFRNVNYNVKKEIENTECTCFDSDNSISKSSKNFYVTNNKTCNCSYKNKPKCIVLPRTTTNVGNGKFFFCILQKLLTNEVLLNVNYMCYNQKYLEN